MSQVTKEFCEQMLRHAANKEHSPLTIWEEEQLARAWLDREQLRSRVGELEDSESQALKERDVAERYADKLAAAIGVITGVDVGEHSNLENPWENALELSAPQWQWIPVSEKPTAEYCGTTLLVLCKNRQYDENSVWEQPYFVDCSHFDGDDFGICAEVVAYMLAPKAEPPIP